MRWTLKRSWLALVLLAAGCQPINFEKTYTLDAGDVKSAAFDAPRYAQKIKVTITPEDGPVEAYVVKDPESKFADIVPLSRPSKELILASKTPTKTEEYTLEAPAPAKTPYAILLYASR